MENKKIEEGIIDLEINFHFIEGSSCIIAYDDGEAVAFAIEHSIDEALDDQFLPELRDFLLKKYKKYREIQIGKSKREFEKERDFDVESETTTS